MPHTVSQNAARLFASESGNLSALVLKRLEIESHYHHRPDLAGPGQPLALAALEFGRLLNVVYRYGLFEAFREECAWFAAALGARGSGCCGDRKQYRINQKKAMRQAAIPAHHRKKTVRVYRDFFG